MGPHQAAHATEEQDHAVPPRPTFHFVICNDPVPGLEIQVRNFTSGFKASAQIYFPSIFLKHWNCRDVLSALTPEPNEEEEAVGLDGRQNQYTLVIPAYTISVIVLPNTNVPYVGLGRKTISEND